MSSDFVIRPASVDDAQGMASVHVASWREAYRGTLVPDEVLDAPGLVASRERFWTGALTDRRWAANRVRVAELDGALIGIAMAGPPGGAERGHHLHVLYVLAQHHGTGVGRGLLDAVLDAAEPAALWVGDPAPRAQAFYRKNGFAFDGTARVHDGIRELRMRRPAAGSAAR